MELDVVRQFRATRLAQEILAKAKRPMRLDTFETRMLNADSAIRTGDVRVAIWRLIDSGRAEFQGRDLRATQEDV